MYLAGLERQGCTPMVKSQFPTAPGGRFAKDRLRLDLQAGTVTCPARVTVAITSARRGGGRARVRGLARVSQDLKLLAAAVNLVPLGHPWAGLYHQRLAAPAGPTCPLAAHRVPSHATVTAAAEPSGVFGGHRDPAAAQTPWAGKIEKPGPQPEGAPERTTQRAALAVGVLPQGGIAPVVVAVTQEPEVAEQSLGVDPDRVRLARRPRSPERYR
jgi:hypothetical protein